MKKATADGIIKLKKDTIADLSEAITNQDIEKIELTIRILQNNTIKLNLLEALNTALLIAFGHRESKMIEYLISRGAEINVKEDGITSTPIFKAAEKAVPVDLKEENNSHSAVTPMGQTEVNDSEELMFYLEQ